jgi:hypothetical protein
MSLSLNGTDGVTFNDGSEQWAAASPIGTKNLIINGDMRIAQRGTSVTGVTTNGYRTCDRWNVGVSGAGTWTITQDTDVPSGQGFANSIKYDCTTADASLASNDYVFLAQFLEGQMVQHLKKGTSNAESITLSFWVKSNKTGTYTIEVDDNDNNRSISKTYTIDTADTWEKKTLTFTGDTTGTFDNDNGASFRVYWWLAAGSTWSSGTLQTTWDSTTNANRVSSSNVNLADSTSNYINITGVQLEVGDTATPFEHRPYDMELERCKRYYQKSYEYGTAPGTATDIGRLNMGGNNAGATTSFLMGPHIHLNPEMRTTPTMYGYDGGGAVNKITRLQLSLADSGNNTISIVNQSTKGCTTYSGSGASRSGAGCHFTADAEL